MDYFEIFEQMLFILQKCLTNLDKFSSYSFWSVGLGTLSLHTGLEFVFLLFAILLHMCYCSLTIVIQHNRLKKKNSATNHDIINNIYKPGHFFKLQLFVSWLGHCVPPYWAWICTSLSCVPDPHVLLQLDHCDNTQSTNKKTILLNVCFS